MKSELGPSLWFMFGGIFVIVLHALIAMAETGDKGGHCYPNKTCDAALECWSADGLPPTCVKP